MPVKQLKISLKETLFNLYSIDIELDNIILEETNPDFEGDFTFVVFPFLKLSRKSPEQTASEIGEHLINNTSIVDSFNVVKGFLNIVISDAVWIDILHTNASNPLFGIEPVNPNQPPVVVEYSSPNTNKPLHLGHIRNNLIGQSVSRILTAVGYDVKQVNLINDRGIHICKTMLAYQKWYIGKTPQSVGVKGDKFVGDLYVQFETELKNELNGLTAKGLSEEDAIKQSPLMEEARQMLVNWENRDEETLKLWKMMNAWVLEGFDGTYKRMNIAFDKLYFESETYLSGRDIVLQGEKQGVFYRKDDGSVWADLRNEGLDEKILLRSDGTSVYITQDLGTAVIRNEDFSPQAMVYVVGNEQNYHFQVLKLVLQKAGYKWADNIEHLSYGMVELPDGKMKSREGKVVDADELMDEMYNTAFRISLEAGKAASLPQGEAERVIEMIAQAALKYFILRVDAKKNMVFNPEESIDFNGNTGPFIQYTHARIQSLLQKAEAAGLVCKQTNIDSLHPQEKALVVLLSTFPKIINESAARRNPSLIAQFAFDLAKEYNSFYQVLPVLKEENKDLAINRLNISAYTANVLKSAFHLLGIEMPGVM